MSISHIHPFLYSNKTQRGTQITIATKLTKLIVSMVCIFMNLLYKKREIYTRNLYNSNMTNEHIGQKYGHLTILEFIPKVKYNYKCKCDCGNLIQTSLWNVTKGLRQTCAQKTCQYHLSLLIMKPSTLEDFVKRALIIWGKRYNYDAVKYVNSYTKIKIFCNKCSQYFFVGPNDHLSHKTGCPHCAGNIRKTAEQFIKEAQKVHGNKYDYSKLIYKNCTTSVKIKCKKCGYELSRLPSIHIKKEKGCNRCNQQIRNQLFKNGEPERNKRRIAEKHNRKLLRCQIKNEQFIKEAKRIHGDKYSYVLTGYISASSRVKIICNKCQTTFKQVPSSHLTGTHCCPTCRSIYPNIKTTEQFIKEAQGVHGNKYDYSMTNYHNRETKVKIVCNKCKDVFLQKPYSHIEGHIGCKCSGHQRIFLKDGVICDSMVEAYHYLLLKEQGIDIKHHGLYGGELGQRIYDFYIPKNNLYIEVTGYHKQHNKRWFSYLRNIVKKKQYVAKIGAKFQFIQYGKLTSAQIRNVRKQAISIN